MTHRLEEMADQDSLLAIAVRQALDRAVWDFQVDQVEKGLRIRMTMAFPTKGIESVAEVFAQEGHTAVLVERDQSQ